MLLGAVMGACEPRGNTGKQQLSSHRIADERWQSCFWPEHMQTKQEKHVLLESKQLWSDMTCYAPALAHNLGVQRNTTCSQSRHKIHQHDDTKARHECQHMSARVTHASTET